MFTLMYRVNVNMYKILAGDVKICVMQMIKKRNIFLKEEKEKKTVP